MSIFRDEAIKTQREVKLFPTLHGQKTSDGHSVENCSYASFYPAWNLCVLRFLLQIYALKQFLQGSTTLENFATHPTLKMNNQAAKGLMNSFQIISATLDFINHLFSQALGGFHCHRNKQKHDFASCADRKKFKSTESTINALCCSSAIDISPSRVKPVLKQNGPNRRVTRGQWIYLGSQMSYPSEQGVLDLFSLKENKSTGYLGKGSKDGSWLPRFYF